MYETQGCPYCQIVRRAAQSLDLTIDWRDIEFDHTHARALVDARGRRTVPVLRIERDGGPDLWLPESADIVEFLRAHARGETPSLPDPPLPRHWLHAILIVVVIASLLAAAWLGLNPS